MSQSRPASATRHTLPPRVYLSVIGILSLALFAVMWGDPAFQMQIRYAPRLLFGSKARATRSAPDISKALPNDPDLGLQLSRQWTNTLKKAARIIGSVPNSHPIPILVVYVGDCAGCVNADFPGYKKNAELRGMRMIFLTSASPEDAQAFANRFKLKIGAVSDSGNDLRKQINAAWVPRCYVFSEDGQLLWMQKTATVEYNPFADSSFIAHK